MSSLRAFVDRCKVGFSTKQKMGFALAGLLYVISPIDCIPDFIPLLGQLDDLSVLALLTSVLCSPTRRVRATDDTEVIDPNLLPPWKSSDPRRTLRRD